jgi:hypothetical protein
MSDEAEPKEIEEIVLKAYRQRKRVMIQVNEDEPAQTFYVVTLTGAEKTAWQNSNVNRVKYDTKGVPVGVKSYDGMESGLIHACLRDDQDKPIPAKEIEKWGSPTLTALSKICIEFNGLADKEEEKKA